MLCSALQSTGQLRESFTIASDLTFDTRPLVDSKPLQSQTTSTSPRTAEEQSQQMLEGIVNRQTTKPPHTSSDSRSDESLSMEVMPCAFSSSLKGSGCDRCVATSFEAAGGCDQIRSDASASSVAETPPTPASDIEQARRRKLDYRNVPKLDRTMTDVYGDELYSPNFTITSTSASQEQSVTSPSHAVFSQRINAANSQHLNAAQSPVSTAPRNLSPFRTCSSYASTMSHDKWIACNSPQRMTDERSARQEVQPVTQPVAGALISIENEPETPKTISPKDAVLEYSETETDCNFPLFPKDAVTSPIDETVKSFMPSLSNNCPDTDALLVVEPTNHLSFCPSQIISDMYALPRSTSPSGSRSRNRTPPRLSSSRSNSVTSDKSPHASTEGSKPASCSADTGTYTCTYHGCTQRFGTPLLLQKHKREGHRQPQGSSMPSDAGTPSGLLNTQAGPHRCDRINPSTGKSCNTIFSRPYDLTRHEDTIHNARKQKVRCDLCTEEKTFSRADALTRHYRVCHPDIDLPGGKQRRRGAV
ncbi:hypothetical protein L249_5905 [Ophiocordyceps polyrhachis-furcata BCC 54312]|uniref:C2H2-type domain-containing protein n=1 Tax=Ophiocordyceps polyrhachis-furcata BCC 54312 TaxID=1330021 RepID=A0A367KZP9_9HYPO|nr:hypothetical protein L249_5905 [Ophiocordyceps polyrhachis-furcata BCC 54312]